MSIHKKNKIVQMALATVLVFGMGVAMPSCPGQQAMQQQIDTLQTANGDLVRQVKDLAGQVHSANADLSQIKQLLGQVTTVLKAQKDSIDQLESEMKAMKPKAKAKSKKK